MDEIFANDALAKDPQGDGKTNVKSQVNPVVDSTRHPDEDTPVQQ